MSDTSIPDYLQSFFADPANVAWLAATSDGTDMIVHRSEPSEDGWQEQNIMMRASAVREHYRAWSASRSQHPDPAVAATLDAVMETVEPCEVIADRLKRLEALDPVLHAKIATAGMGDIIRVDEREMSLIRQSDPLYTPRPGILSRIRAWFGGRG